MERLKEITDNYSLLEENVKLLEDALRRAHSDCNEANAAAERRYKQLVYAGALVRKLRVNRCDYCLHVSNTSKNARCSECVKEPKHSDLWEFDPDWFRREYLRG